MTDNDKYNDEYHFSDPDDISPDVLESDTVSEEDVIGKNEPFKVPETNVRRNAIIAVVTLLLGFVLFRYISTYFSDDDIPRSTEQIQPVSSRPATPPPPIPVTQPTPVPVQPSSLPQAAPTTTLDSRAIERLSSLEANQQSLQANVSSMGNQVSSLNSAVTELNNNISELNQAVAALAQRMAEQSSQIELIISRSKPKKPVSSATKRAETPMIKYYVQAVIPGRAWLIGSNGTTLTVREGTPIPGYGVVKLVDSNQGQVLTSTGKIIRFSQQDS